jgi:hypothetical protein
VHGRDREKQRQLVMAHTQPIQGPCKEDWAGEIRAVYEGVAIWEAWTARSPKEVCTVGGNTNAAGTTWHCHAIVESWLSVATVTTANYSNPLSFEQPNLFLCCTKNYIEQINICSI